MTPKTPSNDAARAVPCFLDMEGASLDEAEVAVVSIPYEGTVSYGTGTGQGPQAVVNAAISNAVMRYRRFFMARNLSRNTGNPR